MQFLVMSSPANPKRDDRSVLHCRGDPAGFAERVRALALDVDAQLERDFVRHHDAGYYADTLAVPAATLAQALHAITGKGTKELILDRVMLEAARQLRFTDSPVSQISHLCGYSDPLYFSRAFKRHQGQSPAHYRATVRGTTSLIRAAG